MPFDTTTLRSLSDRIRRRTPVVDSVLHALCTMAEGAATEIERLDLAVASVVTTARGEWRERMLASAIGAIGGPVTGDERAIDAVVTLARKLVAKHERAEFPIETKRKRKAGPGGAPDEKHAVYRMRPALGGPWLVCTSPADVAEMLAESDAPSSYEIEVDEMTQSEIDKIPDDFPGW